MYSTFSWGCSGRPAFPLRTLVLSPRSAEGSEERKASGRSRHMCIAMMSLPPSERPLCLGRIKAAIMHCSLSSQCGLQVEETSSRYAFAFLFPPSSFDQDLSFPRIPPRGGSGIPRNPETATATVSMHGSSWAPCDGLMCVMCV